MPYPSNRRVLTDKTKRLSIKILKETGFISPGSVVTGPLIWSENFRMYAEVNTYLTDDKCAGEGHINLSHFIDGHSYEYDIRITSKKSNLDSNALIWFLICPVSEKLCRKMYFNGNLFVHQSQIDGLYTSQTLSRKAREFQKIFQLLLQPNNTYAQPMQKNFRKTYRGKPTKRYANVIKLKKRLSLITEEDIERVLHN